MEHFYLPYPWVHYGLDSSWGRHEDKGGGSRDTGMVERAPMGNG